MKCYDLWFSYCGNVLVGMVRCNFISRWYYFLFFGLFMDELLVRIGEGRDGIMDYLSLLGFDCYDLVVMLVK